LPFSAPGSLVFHSELPRARAARPYNPQSEIRNPKWLHSAFRICLSLPPVFIRIDKPHIFR
jgi:hypothetical protein